MLLQSGKPKGAGQKCPLRIYINNQSLPVPQQQLCRLALTIYKKERIPLTKTISLVFCSDHAIRNLNAGYRKINRATDVLSFTLDDDDFLGEIYISLERVKVQARRYEISFNDEITRLFVHGFFHLLGYDHKKEAERLLMEKKESFYAGNDFPLR
jgi:probable rRNA maturation factor